MVKFMSGLISKPALTSYSSPSLRTMPTPTRECNAGLLPNRLDLRVDMVNAGSENRPAPFLTLNVSKTAAVPIATTSSTEADSTKSHLRSLLSVYLWPRS